MLKLILSALFSLFILLSSYACFANNDAAELLKKIDELFRSQSSVATMKMQIVTPNWQRTLEMQSWTLGMDNTFIRVLSPHKDRGVATLKIDKEMWNYFPKINKVIKVPPSMMMGSWMGSDFTNDDLVREVSLVKEYKVSKQVEGDNFRLTLIPKKDTVTVWGKIEFIVNKQSLLPLQQNYYNEKGVQVRTMIFSDIRYFSGKKMPAVMTMIPLNKTGHKTIIKYVEAEFNSDISNNVFTLRNLQKRF
jgi:outer membrane lipoprotein-sorting protein